MQATRTCLASTLAVIIPWNLSKLSLQEWICRWQPSRRQQWPRDRLPLGFNRVSAFSASVWPQFWVSSWNEEKQPGRNWGFRLPRTVVFTRSRFILIGFAFAELSCWLEIQACVACDLNVFSRAYLALSLSLIGWYGSLRHFRLFWSVSCGCTL